jgi:hypothetical protein
MKDDKLVQKSLDYLGLRPKYEDSTWIAIGLPDAIEMALERKDGVMAKLILNVIQNNSIVLYRTMYAKWVKRCIEIGDVEDLHAVRAMRPQDALKITTKIFK